MDLFSKSMEAIPMKDQEAVTVAEAGIWLAQQIRVPVTLLSDQGRNVDGALIRELCAKYGITKLHSNAYHPEGDGDAERTPVI